MNLTAENLEADLETLDRNSASTDEDKMERKSAATVLVELAMEQFRFGVSETGETFALPKSGPSIVAMLRGAKTSLRSQLARSYFKRTRRAAPQQALADALLVIEGMAQAEEPTELYMRVAHYDDALWLDLGDQTGLAVKITDGEWVVTQPPILFKRTALNSPLPEPVDGGSLDDLWKRLNVTKYDRALVAAWLVSAFYHDIPHPVLSLFGEQGTGKTTVEKLLVSCIDASPVPTRKAPRDADVWITAVTGSWIVGLDNLSNVSPWLSDSICRAVTGDGDVRRKLYTDSDYAIFAFRRAIILNGIDLGALRGDLSERLLPIHLDMISEHNRLDEHAIWPTWEKEHPRILGAILDLAASVKSKIPFVRLETKPRMADFARILAAVDETLGTDGLKHYLDKQKSLATDSLSSDLFMSSLIEHITTPYTGTSADLLQLLVPDKPQKGWPTTARVVTQRLHRHAPALRKSGWTVTNDDGHNHRHALTWTINPPDRPEMTCISSSQHAQARENGPKRESASFASQEYRQSQDDKASSVLAFQNGGKDCIEGEL